MLSLIINLRCFHNTLSEPDINELLYLVTALLNSLNEKSTHSNTSLDEVSFKMLVLT